MEVLQEVVVARSVQDSEYRAIVTTVDIANCKFNPPMAEALKEIKVAFHPARKTPIGFEVLLGSTWISFREFDEPGSPSVVEILESGESATKALIEQLKIEAWLRFARIGIL
jgi:hypothetical protein